MTKKKVVVLGANSFSGQDFVDLLLERNDYQVIGVSRSAERSACFLKYRRRDDLSHYRYHQLDFNRDMAAILALLDAERPEYIVNFAAQSEVGPSWDHPEHWFQTNCVALAEMVNHLRKQNYLKRYLHISSPEAYGNCRGQVYEDAPLNPSTPYAASKAAADFLLSTYQRQYDFPLMIVRATNVYGPGQQLFKIIPRTFIYTRTGQTLQLHGGGYAVKSYIHVRDVSRGELAVLEEGRLGEIYHISPDEGYSIRHIVETICRISGKAFEDVTEVVADRPGQDARYVINSEKARNAFGWKPRIDLETGLADVGAWVESWWDEIAATPLAYIHKA